MALIAIASFGDRPCLFRLIASIQRFTDMPIRVYTDKARAPGVETVIVSDFQWQDHARKWVRNTNLVLAKAALDDEVVCCLNDDMRVVHKGFLDGFALAERFGACVPMNPRVYVKYNAMGADGGDYAGPGLAPACNVSPMFASRKHPNGRTLLTAYATELQFTMRGTLALWNASWRTGITPVYLPEQWCVCVDRAEHIRDYRIALNGTEYSVEPIMLHEGHVKVREVFDD